MPAHRSLHVVPTAGLRGFVGRLFASGRCQGCGVARGALNLLARPGAEPVVPRQDRVLAPCTSGIDGQSRR